ncbi:MAG: response regulator [Desulfobacteraceae bacterium]|nr:response regulator [Desulfobacteraceae bacterium]
MDQDKKTILLVEDDIRLADLVSEYLAAQGFIINVEYRGDTAVTRIIREQPDMVILDLMLPGKDGLSVCRDVRNDYPGPILILTAKEDDMDQVAGLELGADDYVKKPVEPRVLLARIRAVFRRADRTVNQTAKVDTKQEKLCFGTLEIAFTSREVSMKGRPIELSTTEFDLLWLLASNSGKVLDRDHIYRTLKGIEYDGQDRSMDVAVSRLRKKLEDDPHKPFRIKTVWGSGYLFVETAWS